MKNISSDDDSDDDIVIHKNRFIINDSESESESETETELDENLYRKTDENNKINIIKEEIIKEEIIKEETIKEEIIKEEIIKEDNLDEKDINYKNKKNSMNKKERIKVQESNKDRRDKKESNDINNRETLYSDTVEILINGKKLINECRIVINDGIKYSVIGKNGSGKTTLLKHIYNKITLNNTNEKKVDILMIDQDIEINDNEESIIEFILNADELLNSKYNTMRELDRNENLTDEEMDIYNECQTYIYDREWINTKQNRRRYYKV